MTRGARRGGARGVTINGLPILSVEPDLDRYYFDNVIGGPGAFMIPAASYDTFADAIIKKLISEIALQSILARGLHSQSRRHAPPAAEAVTNSAKLALKLSRDCRSSRCRRCRGEGEPCAPSITVPSIPQTLVVLETAFDEAWLTLKAIGNSSIRPDELARSMLRLAMEGERDPVRLHDGALKGLIPATAWREAG